MENQLNFQQNAENCFNQFQLLHTIKRLLLDKNFKPLSNSYPSLRYNPLIRMITETEFNLNLSKNVEHLPAGENTPYNNQKVVIDDECSCNLSSNSLKRKRSIPVYKNALNFRSIYMEDENEELEDDATSSFSYDSPSTREDFEYSIESDFEDLENDAQTLNVSLNYSSHRETLPGPNKKRKMSSDFSPTPLAGVRGNNLTRKIMILQDLVPVGKHHLDVGQMLDQAINYVRELQAQVRIIESTNACNNKEKGAGGAKKRA